MSGDGFDFDLFTLGAGSGGVRASRVAAEHGARVAVAEERALGGTCVNVGCVPKKLLVYASHFRDDFEDAAGFGWSVGERRHDWATLIARKNREIARLNGVYANLLDQAGVERIEGRARILDAHTVAVGERRFRSRHLLVAVGARPKRPDVPGSEHAITSDEAFFLERLPERVLLVGGGYVAVEFAGIFHGLGSRVTQLYRGPLFLRGFDDDLRKGLADEMDQRGVTLRFGTDIARIERTGTVLRATLRDGSEIETDVVFYATGRQPYTGDLGLEGAGVKCDGDGAIVVNEYSCSSVPSIHAVGDVTNRKNLTPVAIAEGQALADTLFGESPTPMDHRGIASAVFSQPALASVGLTEAEARATGSPVDVYRSRFRALEHTLSGRDEHTLVKLVVDRDTDRVLGCHMLGPDAPEIVQGLAIALRCGATKAQFDGTIGIHPTAAEEFVTLRKPVAGP
jgi:glutathione reductase (NADPH)